MKKMNNKNPVEGKIIEMRETMISDIDFVMNLERLPENRVFVLGNTEKEHMDLINNPDDFHLIVQECESQKRVGFLLMSRGTGIKRHNLELRRIVIKDKGKGYGRITLDLVKDFAFKSNNFHRLWLDVYASNRVARRLYEREGFEVEGILRDCLQTGEKEYTDLIVMSIIGN